MDALSLFRQHIKISRQRAFKFIDRLIIILSLIVILTSLLWDFNYLQYKAPIEYENWKTITLNDFRGLNRPFNTLDGGTKFAFVFTTIDVSQSRDRIVIKTFFHPCRSYVYNRNLFSEELLTHELYHFHIAEYYARLMRKEVTHLSQFKTINNLDELKDSIVYRENQLQYEYDDETYHGYVLGKQIEWQHKIDSCLLSLKDFSQTFISLKK
ncbi:MAG: DUF922 domain-containing protein [Bacteroidota bacterium]